MGNTSWLGLFEQNEFTNLEVFSPYRIPNSGYDTLKHIVRAEQSYLFRLSGRQSTAPMQLEDNPELAALRAYAQQAGEGLIALAADPAATGAVHQVAWEDGTYRAVPAILILVQAINHGAEHREQVLNMLTQQGIEPPDLSGWGYAEESIAPATAV